MQPQVLFPIEVRSTYPPPVNSSADAAFHGIGENGIEYVIKTVPKTPHAPAAEWFCHRFADTCGIAVPQTNRLLMADGSEAFGSQWDGAVLDQMLVQQVLTGALKGNFLDERLSAIYAFDLAVHNVDRHTGNYLFVKGMGSNVMVRAFDFSRAWTVQGWPLPALPLAPCHTVNYYRNTSKVHPFNLKAAEKLLDAINKVPISAVQSWLADVPGAWQPKTTQNQIVKWWAAGGMKSRTDAIRKGLQNGSYL